MINNVIPTASSMLEEVYVEQFKLACSYVKEQIKMGMTNGTNSISFSLDELYDELPIVRIQDIIEDLNIKGYKASLEDNNRLNIDWSEVKPLNPPVKVKAEATVGHPRI